MEPIITNQKMNDQPNNTPAEKIKCYELDFGDTNLISQNKKDILDWIEADMDSIDDDGLEYRITTKFLTQEEFNNLPEWQ